MAAPFVASGASVVIGASAAAGIATTAGAAIFGTMLGVGGAGLAGYRMQKRVGSLDEFAIETLTDGQSLHCTLAVSGWIDQDTRESFTWPWRHLADSGEQYALRYETKYLLDLGRAIDYFMSMAVSVAVQQTLMETALAGLMAAIAWPVALISASAVIDNPWNVGVQRAVEAGHHLAELILRRQHGRRPVSLFGFSLGARVVYHCLLAMSQRPDHCGIIEGAPSV